MRRVLVTGSRNWPHSKMVWSALTSEFRHGAMTVVHGACPSGADDHANMWFRLDMDEGHPFFATEEPHPADWEKHGKAAGPLRNQEMVDLGADVCLAFPMPDSRGTRDCIRRARAAGIPVITYSPDGSTA